MGDFFLRKLLRVLLPESCALCEQDNAEDMGLCKVCLRRLKTSHAPSRKAPCLRCGLHAGPGLDLCPDCAGNHTRSYSFIRFARYLKDGHHEALKRYKDGKIPGLATWYADELASLYQRERRTFGIPTFHGIVPVPPRPGWRRERLYDPVARVARLLSHILGIPYLPVLTRRHGTQQKRLSKEERIHNAQGSYIARNHNKKVSGNLILVDDVITTGSTVEACSKCLMQAGAGTVVVLALCRN